MPKKRYYKVYIGLAGVDYELVVKAINKKKGIRIALDNVFDTTNGYTSMDLITSKSGLAEAKEALGKKEVQIIGIGT
jgi:hypothetical protein